nr:acyl-CoA dehydrogenase family protein [Acidovorax sp.]
MGNFNAERFGLAASALGFAEACYDEALAWARQRKTFGAPLVAHQVIRHKLVDMQMRIPSTRPGWTRSARRPMQATRGGGGRRVGGPGLPAQEPRHADHALRRTPPCSFWVAWATCAAP